MATFQPLTVAAVKQVIETKNSVSIAESSRVLAKSLGIPYKLDGRYADIEARDEVVLEFFVDALQAVLEAGCNAAKATLFLQIQQRLWAAMVTGLPPEARSRSLSSMQQSHGHRSPSAMTHSATSLPSAAEAPKEADSAVATAAEAADFFEELMRPHTCSSFADSDAESKFTLEELKQLVKHVYEYGFVKHFTMYRHVMSAPQRHHEERRTLVVEAPLGVAPLADATQVA